jgi:hypothetical protein
MRRNTAHFRSKGMTLSTNKDGSPVTKKGRPMDALFYVGSNRLVDAFHQLAQQWRQSKDEQCTSCSRNG